MTYTTGLDFTIPPTYTPGLDFTITDTTAVPLSGKSYLVSKLNQGRLDGVSSLRGKMGMVIRLPATQISCPAALAMKVKALGALSGMEVGIQILLSGGVSQLSDLAPSALTMLLPLSGEVPGLTRATSSPITCYSSLHGSGVRAVSELMTNASLLKLDTAISGTSVLLIGDIGRVQSVSPLGSTLRALSIAWRESPAPLAPFVSWVLFEYQTHQTTVGKVPASVLVEASSHDVLAHRGLLTITLERTDSKAVTE